SPRIPRINRTTIRRLRALQPLRRTTLWICDPKTAIWSVICRPWPAPPSPPGNQRVVMHAYPEIERPIAELEGKIVELRKLAEEDPAMQIDAEVGRLQAKADGLIKDTYAKLSPWQKVQVARHPGRPHFSDYAKSLFDEFTPLAGDRSFGDDFAIVAAM